MKSETFDKIVTNRAHERACKRISVFRREVMDSCKKLVGSHCGYQGTTPDSKVWYPDFQNILKILTSDDVHKGWPKQIWEEESAAVTKELLSIMDEMQKALLAPNPSPDDAQPEVEGGAA
jgi:hypothetical protein